MNQVLAADPVVTEILDAWRSATSETQAKALDYLRRVNSPDPATRERARAELLAEVAEYQ